MSETAEIRHTTPPPGRQFVFTNSDLTKEECLAAYKQWGGSEENSFDEYERNNCNGGKMAAEAAMHVLGDRKDARILDLGAGTGSVGEKLKNKGYENLDAFEPCDEMYAVAEKKNVYKHRYNEYLTEERTQVPSDTYDAMTLACVYTPGHMQIGSLREMIRMIKPGGYWVNVMMEEYLTTDREYRKLEPLMRELEQEGLWTLVSRTVDENYCRDTSCGTSGVVFVYKVT